MHDDRGGTNGSATAGVGDAPTLALELTRARCRWLQTVAAHSTPKDRSNAIESRRPSRWSSAIEILKRRLERTLQDERSLELLMTEDLAMISCNDSLALDNERHASRLLVHAHGNCDAGRDGAG